MLSQSLDLLRARDYPETFPVVREGSYWKGISWASPGEVLIILAPFRLFPPPQTGRARDTSATWSKGRNPSCPTPSSLGSPPLMSASFGRRARRIRVLGHQLRTWDVADNPQEELILSPVEGRALQIRPGNICWEMEAQ